MVRKNVKLAKLVILFFMIPFFIQTSFAAADNKQLIYDNAGLLSESEINQLEALAMEYSAKRETDFIILTTNDTKEIDIKRYMQDFYDDMAPGYDQPHGNTAILTVDISDPNDREIYLAGFKKAEKYLDDSRLDQIRDKIIPSLSNGQYFVAFEQFIETSYKYMGYKPGVNPENILFKTWFQIVISLSLGGIVVGIMAYNSGGRVTINSQTYQDASSSRILSKKDVYLRTTTTKRRKPSDHGGGSGRGGGGGGMTRGGHSHSGSRGSF